MINVPTRRFYQTDITQAHNTGDIWSNLPTHGLLKISHVPGIIITPACDLANEKADTLTYLPILTISHWLSTKSFYSELRGSFLGLLDSLKLTESRELLSSPSLPTMENLEKLKNRLKDKVKSKGFENNARRCLKGISHLKKMISLEATPANTAELEEFFGRKTFENLIHRIIRNSYTNEIHFIPSDEQNKTWSIVEAPSLVLFRYPLTAPIEVFDYAQMLDVENWDAEMETLASDVPFISAFGANRPLKGLRMDHPFLHDMLVRYVSLFSRLGSPDFTNDSISRIYLSLVGAKE